MIKLYGFQEGKVTTPNCALYWGPGLGKTYSSIDRALQYGSERVLVVCQKSKVKDWCRDIETYTGYKTPSLRTGDWERRVKNCAWSVINYDLLYRRLGVLRDLRDYTLILDESSLIKNPSAQRTKAVRQMKPDHIILLSGTPCSGKYEELVTQSNLLGWKISKDAFWSRYVRSVALSLPGKWFPIQKVVGYKNVDELKDKLREYGADFKLPEDCVDLPGTTYTDIRVDASADYKKFEKSLVLNREDGEVITGDTPLVKLLRLRQLANSPAKTEALSDLMEGIADRVVIFYNFNEELPNIEKAVGDRPKSYINGSRVDLTSYEECEDAVVLVQYQAGSYGHNLQKANKIIFYSPTLSSEQYDQSERRILRIGQDRKCFYWKLITNKSVEEKIYATLAERKDYNIRLFKEDYEV